MSETPPSDYALPGDGIGVTRFDPYAVWLDLRPGKPGSLYELLNVDENCSTADIEQAAQQQMAKLRKYQVSQHRDAAESLMNEVSAACDTLIDIASRRRYDEQRAASTAQYTPENPPPAPSGDSTRLSLPAIPPPADCGAQLLICPMCQEWWMVSAQLAGRQILCVGCQGNLQVSPDVCSLTRAPAPPAPPLPPLPPEPPILTEPAATEVGQNVIIEEVKGSGRTTTQELEDYAGQFVVVVASTVLLLAVLLSLMLTL